ncbi:MAG: hypothetical protein K8S25_11195 [Alphaproteobacteria bacterium]|nr:hypothetical protein [Alphaproteobacteria bacterium]
MTKFVSKRARSIFLLPLLMAGGACAAENVGTSTQPLTIKNVQTWTENGNIVPVCWESPGFDREKAIVKAAVRATWERNSGISFSGWGDCPRSGTEKFVRVATSSQDDNNGGANGATYGLGMAVLKSAADGEGRLLPPRSMIMTFNADGSADQGRVEYIGVHEFGHVLGFVHEQDTPGNVEGPAHCASPGNEPDSRSLTTYDRDSVMNYCNKNGNMSGELTATDIAGVQAVYGVHTAKALGRVKLPPGTPAAAPLSICDAAKSARARNSPAAPGLERRCLASGGH